MIKNFSHVANGVAIELCASLGEGPGGERAIISRADSADTLVMMDIGNGLALLKARLESPEAFLDDAIRKAKDGGLIDKALREGTPQTGKM